MSNIYCYSETEEGVFSSYEESAIDAALSIAHGLNELYVGAMLCYYRGEVIDYKSSDFITDHLIQNFFEDLNCSACDELGESAEDFGYHSPEAAKELKDFLKSWMDKNITCAFYGVKNVVEVRFTVDQKIYDDFMGE